MSFSKANDLKRAEKLVQQGKIAAAIKEYSNLVAANPSDIMLLNTLGDLCVRDGRIDEAILYFTKIGENYSKNGFTLKAIAMYKKIYKLAPNNPEIAYKLAELYAKQGLIVDARKQYMEVADAYTRAGRTQQALDVLRKIADLDPDNVSVRLKLAERYQSERMNDKAHEAYIAAGAQLQRKGNLEESQQCYMKALAVEPSSKPALSSLANIFIQLGDPQRAISMLNRVIDNNPNDPDLVTLMGRTYLSAEMLDDAEKAFIRLHDIDKTRFEYLLQLGRKFADQGQFDRAVDTVTACIDTVITRRQESKAIDLLDAIIELDPYHIPTYRCLKTIYTRMGEDNNLSNALNGLVEAALHHQQREIAGEALRQLVELEPNDSSHRRRLEALGLSTAVKPTLVDRDSSTASSLTPKLGPGIGSTADFKFGTDLYPDSNQGFTGLTSGTGFTSGTSFSADSGFSPGAPAQGFGGFGAPPPPTFPTQEGPTGFTGFVSGSQFPTPDRGAGSPNFFATVPPPVSAGPDIQKLLMDADRYASRGYADRAAEILREVTSLDPHHLEARLKLKDIYLSGGLNTEAAEQCLALAHIYDAAGDSAKAQKMLTEAFSLNPNATPGTPQPPVTLKAPEDAIEIDISGGFDGGISGNFNSYAPPSPPPPPVFEDHFYSGAPHHVAPPPGDLSFAPLTDTSHIQDTLREELEGVDFYLSQGFTDLAADTLNRLNAQFPNHPEIQSRMAKLAPPPVAGLPPTPPAPPSFDFSTAMGSPGPSAFAPPPPAEYDFGGLGGFGAPPVPAGPAAGPPPFSNISGSGGFMGGAYPGEQPPPTAPISAFQPPVAPPPVEFQPPVASPPIEFQPPSPGANLFGAPSAPLPPPAYAPPPPPAYNLTPPPPPAYDLAPPPPPAYDMSSAMMAGPPSVDSLIESLITDIGDSLDGIDDLEMVNRVTGAHQAAPPPPPPPPSLAAPAPVAQGLFSGLEESGLQDIFDEFKNSIEQEEAEEVPDFETHYNLGLAYKDMELFDEAVEEFQTAIKATDPHAPDGHYFQSCNMLGLCFMSKTMYPPAAVWFKRGLDAPGRSEDEYQAMRFDLGLAHEMQGKLESALELFEIVYAIDINYRDVGEKIKEIKEKLRK